MSAPTVEATQSAVLQALATGPIEDTRTLAVNGTPLGSDGQAVVKAALDSLLSKEVRCAQSSRLTPDGHLPTNHRQRVHSLL